MKDNRKGWHTTSRLTAHIVWVTKYRYHVLQGDIKLRCRDLLVQICDSEDVRILKGVVSKDHVHMHIEYAPKLALAELVKPFERTFVKTNSTRVSASSEAILGTTLLGNGIRCLVNRQYHGRNSAAIS